jgi:hypothetical protein
VYQLPVYLRTYYYKKLIEIKEKEADEVKNASKSSKGSKIDRPTFR